MDTYSLRGAFCGRALKTFSFHDGAFVRAASDLPALILSTDFENEQLSFAAGKPGVGCNDGPRRSGRRVSDIDGHPDRQLAWPKHRLHRARGGHLHQRNHAGGRKYRGKRIAVFVRDRTREICWTNDEFGCGGGANF